MAADPLDALRLTLMQDVLPVGLAVVERARQGGPRQVMAAFDGSSSDPLGQLRQEGEPAAGQLRDRLDQFSPGLGNPVMKVEVRAVDPEDSGSAIEPDEPEDRGIDGPAPSDPAELQAHLSRISRRLTLLESRLLGRDGDSPEADQPEESSG